MNSDVIIRTYAAADHPVLKEVFFSNVPAYFGEQEWPDFDAFLRDDINQDCRYYVLLKNGTAVGAGGIALNENGTISLCWGMVHADLHRSGLGKALLEYRLVLAEQIWPGHAIGVSTSQHATGFFEKYGFVTTRTEKNFWLEGMDLYEMQKRN